MGRKQNLQKKWLWLPGVLRHCCTWLAIALSVTPVLVAAEGYSFGVLPYLVPKTMAEMYGPATLDIGAKLGKPVMFKTAGGFDKFREKLQSQEYDIAVIQPFDYPLVVDELGYLPLAQIKVDLHAVVIVKEETTYRGLADLDGKRVAMAPRHAATSRQGMWALKGAGLLEGGRVTVEFLGSHDACMHALQVDNADACITGPPPYKDFVARTGAKMRVLQQTESIPHILAVAHPRVPEVDRQAISRIMTGWEQDEAGRQVLKSMRFPGWKPAEPDRYAIMREYLELETVQPAEGVQRGGMVYGSFPYFAPRVLAEKVAPMIEAFSTTVGRPVHFRTTPSFERFRENLGQGQYDIALIRPYDYETAATGGYLPVARDEKDLVARIYVRQDSPYRSLADLEGQVVALPPSTAVLNIQGQQHLRRVGINYVPAVRSGHDVCMKQMIEGKAAACVTGDITIQAMGYTVGRDVRVLDSTKNVPGLMFVVHKRHSDATRQRLRELVLGWNDSDEGQLIIKRTGLGPFTKVDVRDYEALRDR